MNGKEILKSIINDFQIEKFKRFFRDKSNTLSFPDEPLHFEFSEDKFTEIRALAKGKLDDGELIVCSILVCKSLSDRSSKKEQYILGKKILKEQQADAGIFIFYDDKGHFRFSLIYTNYLGKRRDWSNFKRFTYFVSKDLTNKTFLKQIGEGDFSTLANIKQAFSVDPVSKQFYDEIQNWYFWAMDKIKFPDDYKYSSDTTKDEEIRNATNLIRLITRIIFIWFIKEKDLIPAVLFSSKELKGIVSDFLKDKNSSNYYNAILQNLFFGTLNQKMNERKFADERSYPATKKEFGVKNLYRYADKFLISEDEVLKLFKDIPFLNGGLFDCLDKEDEKGKIIYVDGFSRNPQKQAIIPDYLFFQQEEEKLDLSEYGIGSNKPVRGLIEILSSYNFTIDENTPIDQEIALDPELLGKVFENLLASYNPETATPARKATGSYYTPREIVDYMVETSLLEYLKQKLPDINEEKLKTLLSYSEEIPQFSEEEIKKLISTTDEIKILDPACGSGAFPMGILHKLVHTLQKLDPENKYWYELQYQKALKESEKIFKEEDKKIREEKLKEINETFDESINYPDYARKLYLIENCIYGIDIQPIAIQISKLRFFISLVLDQKVDKDKENYGIRSLPNLETKFVAANTLIGLDKPSQFSLRNPEIEIKENELEQLRHKYFTANTRKEKIALQMQDKKLRKQIAKLLENDGWDTTVAKQIAAFDPYDQNTFANWFDPEWMFGITNGFDIVIGNPPYIQLQKEGGKLAEEFKNKGYQTYDRMGDIYTLFYEKGISLLKQKGILAYITSNKWMRAGYGENLRNFFTKYNPLVLIDLGPGVFESATVDTNILIIQKSDNAHNLLAVTISNNKKENLDFNSTLKNEGVTLKKLNQNAWTISSDIESRIKEKIEAKGTPLKDWDVKINYGIKTGFNDAFIIDGKKKDELIAKDPRSAEIIKPILRGRDIKRYKAEFADLWLINAHNGVKEKGIPRIDVPKDYPAIYEHLKQYEKELIKRQDKGDHWTNLRNCAYLEEFEKEKISWGGVVTTKEHHKLRMCFDKNSYINAPANFITGKNLKFIISIINSYLSNWFYNKFIGTILHKDGIRFYIDDILKVFIPQITHEAQQPFIELVDIILQKKEKNQDTTAEERQIDEMVYELYGLTEDEIATVEGKRI